MKYIFLDRDGTINERPPVRCYVTSPEAFVFLPGAKEALKAFVEHGYQLILVTNQAGVGTGVMTEEDLTSVHRKMISELGEIGVEFLEIYACTDSFDSGSTRRKPHPTMFYEARDTYGVNLQDCYYVGDDPRDMIAAYNAGMKSCYVGDTSRLDTLAPEYTPHLQAENLLQASQFFLDG